MPTNRTRRRRTPRNRIPLVVTPEYVRRLKLRDFMGRLEAEEISLAKELGVYRFDAWAKARRAAGQNAEQRAQETIAGEKGGNV